MIYQIILPLSSLDIIPQEISSDLLFKFSEDKDFAFNKKFEDLGYGSHNMIQNVGSMFFYIIIILFVLILALIFRLCRCKNKCVKQTRKTL